MMSNIYKLYCMQALRWFLLFMPTFVLFFQDKGFSLAETLLLQAIFSIAIVVLEIPSGYFSDYFGRKKTLVIGSIFGTLGYLCYAYSFEFWHFIVAETLLGLGASFISGTDSALLYDTLKELNKTKAYKKYEGFMQSISSFSEGFAAIAGGFIALISLSAPFFVQTGLLFFTVLIALSIKNPTTQTRKDQHDNPIKDLLKIVKFTLHDHKEIRSLILYSGIIGGSTLTLVFLIQPFLQEINIPLALFGILWAAFNFSIGIFALTTNRIEEFFGKTKSVALLILLVAIGYFGLGYFNSYFAIGLIFIFYFIRAVSGTIIKDYINQLIDSDIRATVLSVKNLSSRMVFAIMSPFIGHMADIYSLSVAFYMAGTFFTLFGLITLAFLLKYDSTN